MEHVYNDELYHYGRKGMKWGQHIYGKVKQASTKRKRKKNLEKARAAKVQKAVKAKLEAEQAKKPKTVGEMTNDELRDAINRLQMEKQYKQLMSEMNTKNVSRGKKYVNDFLDKSVKPAVEEASKQLMKDALNKAGQKALGLEKPVDTLEQLRKDRDAAQARRTIAQVEDFFEKREQEKNGSTSTTTSKTRTVPRKGKRKNN